MGAQEAQEGGEQVKPGAKDRDDDADREDECEQV